MRDSLLARAGRSWTRVFPFVALELRSVKSVALPVAFRTLPRPWFVKGFLLLAELRMKLASALIVELHLSAESRALSKSRLGLMKLELLELNLSFDCCRRVDFSLIHSRRVSAFE
jgi:hypothetical protein